MEVDARTFDQVVASLDRNHAALCAASAGILDDIAALDEAGSWGEDEASLSCFLAGRYGVSSGTAREWVRVARALRDLPAIRDAHRNGAISWDKLRPLTRIASPETDERLAEEAPEMRLSRLWLEARRQDRARREEMESDHRMRYLRMGWDDEGRFLYLEGSLPAEQGAAVEAALERRAQEVTLEDGPLYDRQGARLADALAELVTSAGGSAVPATLVVHADASVLAGIPAPRPGSGRDGVGGPALKRGPSAGWPATPGWSGWPSQAAGRWASVGRAGCPPDG